MSKIVRKKTIRREILRKMIHLLELPVLIAYALVSRFYGDKFAMLVITVLLIILLEIEYIRLEYKLSLPLVVDILRRKEKDNIASNIFFVASTIICFAAFDFQIAILALLLAVFGDLMAAIVGMSIGRKPIFKKKTLEGFVAGLITNILIGMAIMPNSAVIYVPMALAASLTELFTGKLDDNLTVPLAAGFIGQMLLYYWQIPVTGFPGPIVGRIVEWIPFLH